MLDGSFQPLEQGCVLCFALFFSASIPTANRYCRSVGDWARMGFTAGGIGILYVFSQLYSKVSKAMGDRQRKKAMEALGVE